MLQQMAPAAPDVPSAYSIAPMKVLLSVEEAAAALSMGRTFVYHLLARGDIFSVKVGRTRRVPVKALHDYVDRLVCQQERA